MTLRFNEFIDIIRDECGREKADKFFKEHGGIVREIYDLSAENADRQSAACFNHGIKNIIALIREEV